MKRSNKTLIGLALFCLIVPTCIDIALTKAYRLDKVEFNKMLENEALSLDVEGRFLKRKITTAFKEVAFEGTAGLYCTVIIIPSTTSGYKIQKNYAHQIQEHITADGKLQLTFTDKKEEAEPLKLYIYSPNAITLRVANVHLQNLKIDTETLTLQLHNIKGELNLEEGAAVRKVDVHAVNSDFILYKTAAVDKQAVLKLTLDSSKVNYNSSLNTLIMSANNSEFGPKLDARGNPENANLQINRLELSTLGSTQIKLGNTLVKEVSGTVSDATKIDLSVIQLKKLLGTH
ncbi:hypothetical protein ACL9RF_05815 [Sphingobacterium sp. Mn56C]|uniref:hypothetical protein n=1 Tax=Sphingobacterium sp. Mn56C TaxID=3395261 RepID=UPI003BC7F640